MRETRPSGSEGGGAGNRSPYPYPMWQPLTSMRNHLTRVPMATRISGPPASSRADHGRKPDHPEADFYFQRFGFCGRQIAAPAPRDLGLVVVIPCFNEPDLLG